jgi:hypothetical protein
MDATTDRGRASAEDEEDQGEEEQKQLDVSTLDTGESQVEIV